MKDKQDEDDQVQSRSYVVTGTAAHSRIAKLLPSDWHDETHTINKGEFKNSLHFLWENQPRRETKTLRDHVQCYSHLPNGITLLDDKGKVAQLLSHRDPCPTTTTDSVALAILDTVVFQGKEGFQSFLQQNSSPNNHIILRDTFTIVHSSSSTAALHSCSCCGVNLWSTVSTGDTTLCSTCQYYTQQVWVIKDVHSNGASGIWFLDSNQSSIPTSLFPLQQQHSSSVSPRRFVAQRYAWPLILFHGRKFHIRVYVIFTCDGQVFIHKCAFLHVANEPFQYPSGCRTKEEESLLVEHENLVFQPSMHITNCCANSHDVHKFTGEICADLTQYIDEHAPSYFFSPYYETIMMTPQDDSLPQTSPSTVVPLGEFFPSICATVKTLAQQSFYFLQGGEANNGFEYLGLDFILSYRPVPPSTSKSIHPITFHGQEYTPLAYLLEVNAPPSQDTATGLPHAEALHDQVLKDWMNYWVIPHAMSQSPDRSNLGGWMHVYSHSSEWQKINSDVLTDNTMITPSKSAWLNKVRWALYEKAIIRQDKHRHASKDISQESINSPPPLVMNHENNNSIEVTRVDSIMTKFRRKYFPFFQKQVTSNYGSTIIGPIPRPWIYFENAGGTQVPCHVINSMTQSLSHRHREIVGAQDKTRARTTLSCFLRAPQSSHEIFFGPNATTMIDRLASVMIDNKWLQKSDEIIIATENHRAHVDPWLRLKQYGINIRWWKSYSYDDAEANLRFLLTPKTRLVCLSHASNVLGSVRDIKNLCSIIREYEKSQESSSHPIQVIVDGVGAASHLYPNVANDGVDWYVLSCHKLYGPTTGVLCGKKESIRNLFPSIDGHPYNNVFEPGTVNYEGCAGIQGIWMYFSQLALLHSSIVRGEPDKEPSTLSENAAIPANDIYAMKLLDQAYQCIVQVERTLYSAVMEALATYPNLTLMRDTGNRLCQIPIVCFVHKTLGHSDIVQYCLNRGIILRVSTFLATDSLLHDMGIVDKKQGMIRLSLSHYNTLHEVHELLRVFESMDGW